MLRSQNNALTYAFVNNLQFQGVVDGKGLKANEWVKEVSTVIGGKGGGKPLSAQGSGDNIKEINKAINLAKEFASLKLS